MKVAIKYFIALMGLTALPVLASGSGAKVAEGVNYIAIEPALVVNYGGPGKARFIKAELSLRTETAADATEVMHHLPLIRDRLISIFSAQTEEAISTPEGKEYLRVYALTEINKALLAVEGHSVDEQAVGKKKTPKQDAVITGAQMPGEDAVAAPIAVPSVADITPVKGPASDLFFNNFVVQK